MAQSVQLALQGGLKGSEADPEVLLAAMDEIHAAGLDRAAVLEVVARLAAEWVGQIGFVRLISPDGKFADLVSLYHRDPTVRQEAGKAMSRHRLGIDECVFGEVMRTGRSFRVGDFDDPAVQAVLCPAHRAMHQRLGSQGCILVPLVTGGRTFGAIGVNAGDASRPYSADDVRALEALAARAAGPIDNALRVAVLEEQYQALTERATACKAESTALRDFRDRIMARIPGFLIQADRNLVVRWASPLAVSMLGRHIIGRQLSAVLPQALLAPLGEAVDRLRASNASAVAFPSPGRARTNGPYCWDVSMLPLLKKGGALDGIAIVGLEATDRVERDRLRLSLMETQKQVDALKEDIVSVLSHELRTPLHAIIGWGALLEDDPAGVLSPDQTGYLAQILEGAYDLVTTLDKLIDYSLIRAGKLQLRIEAVYLPDIVEAVVSRLWPAAGKRGICIDVDLPDLPLMYADGPRVEQILVNVLDNAIKFSRECGTVRVRAEEQGACIRWEVEDEGPGIGGEDLAQIFEPIHQVEPSLTRSVRGIGLGLFLSRTLAEAHGGQIGVAAGRHGGTVVWCTLPQCVHDAAWP